MRTVALLALIALAGCGSPEGTPAPQPSASPAALPTATGVPAPAAAPTLTPLPQPTRDLSVLDSRDCRTVARAYFNALAQGDFAFAARVWNDPVIDEARLRALFAGYQRPAFAIAGLEQEGAAGSLYCTVSGTLTDAARPAKPAQEGELVLRRVNDVPGATAAQLRWTIRSSTFVEKMERSGTGAPA
jgi:hypothetical protein